MGSQINTLILHGVIATAAYTSACTVEGEDPYATGAEVACCDGLTEKIADWDGDGRQYFKCVSGDVTTSAAPTPVPPVTTTTSASPTTPVTTPVTPGSSTSTTSGPTTSSEPVVTTQSPLPPSPEIPQDGEAVAQWLNSLYKGFDENDDNSPVGVTISMQNEWALYCSDVGAGCFEGHVDCRFSASLFNHKVILDRAKNSIKLTMDRLVGIVFNPYLVETKFGKCSYMFDGASFNRYNGACGCSSTVTDCDDPTSAFGDVCPSTNKKCELQDEEVAQCSCANMEEPTQSDVEQCYFTGAAMDRQSVNHDIDQTRDMIKARLRHQDGTDSNDRLEYWNEVVIDEHLMIEELNNDPTFVLPAFIYKKGDDVALTMAKELRKAYVGNYTMSTPPPLIAVDTEVDVNTVDGPFSFESSLMNGEMVV